MQVSHAQLQFNDNGTPVSGQFDDIYFSTLDGMAETEYVFLDGNDLPCRWQNFKHPTFVIGETGFGTGLNFLTTWWHYRQLKHTNVQTPGLHFISFEKYPISQDDLAQVLSRWPQLQSLTEQLLRQYPAPLAGCHRMSFDDGQVTLDLWLGDIQDTLPQLFDKQIGIVDAWYLDGFAPTKNTAMWHPDVLNGLARLSKEKATIATFTCARMVRDGLTDAGFTLQKRKGFGKKREMLTGCLVTKPIQPISLPFYYRRHKQAKNQVAIVGGGIASAELAYALAKRGYEITLFCKDSKLAQGASQNRHGALYPLLHAQYSPLSEFFSIAFIYALRHYHELLQQGYQFEHDFCGVILQTFNDKTAKRHQALIDSKLWPEHLYQALNGEQCSEIAKLPLPWDGLYFPAGGWINPASLIDALLMAAKRLSTVTVELNQQIEQLNQTQDGSWSVNDQDFANVVVCCGHLSQSFSQTKDLNLSPIRGQVSHLNANQHTQNLSTVLCYSGYVTPAADGQHCIGASFIKGDTSESLRDIEHQRNLERLQAGLGNPDWFEQLEIPTQGRASIRCASIDHLPLAGAVPDLTAYRHTYRELYKGYQPHKYECPPDHNNLYILTGLGARGLCSAPLAAEIVAAQMCNEAYPVSQRVLNALNPGRGYIKQLKSHKPF